ncbi:hypothetical protein Tco_1322086 [Tanacetum coccineum]
MVEPEEPIKKKDQIRLDEELAFKLQAEEEKEERLTREKLKKLQAQEQEELSDAEKATLFVQLLEKRRKHFAAKRAEAKRNIPPTKSQQRSFMCTYLKNMDGWKPKDLRSKVDDAKEAEELKQCLEIVPDDGDDVTIDATP